ncbi:hypothetical protein SSTU70S_01543 [Stutzerimonas stutzeri]
MFSVPLSFFCQDPREVTHRIDSQGQSWYIPSYRYGEYQIWGLTAIMIVELVNLVYDAGIEMRKAWPGLHRSHRAHRALRASAARLFYRNSERVCM